MDTSDWNSQPRKSKKLKASCDFCAISKVKCDRGQPHCQRCVRNEVECHYSESRRIGKARRLYDAFGPTMKDVSSTTSLTSLSCPDDQQWHRRSGSETPSSLDNQVLVDAADPSIFDAAPDGSEYRWSEPPMCFMEGSMTMPPFGAANTLQIPPPSLSSSSTSSSPSCGAAYSTSSFSSPDLLQGITSDYSQLKDVPGMDLGMISTAQVRQFLSTSSGAGEPGGCMRRACAALESLHVPAEQCSLPGASLAPVITTMGGLDAMLKANRAAIDTVLQILDCPCSHGWNISFLVMLIAHQTMDSYWTLLKQQLSSPSTSFPDDAEGGTSSFFDVPLAIGGYILSGEARAQVITQVLRSQIEGMGGLIDVLAARNGSRGADNPTGAFQSAFLHALQTSRARALQASQ